MCCRSKHLVSITGTLVNAVQSVEANMIYRLSVFICKVLESLQNLTTEPTPFLPKLQRLDLEIIAVVVAVNSFYRGFLVEN